MNIKNMEKDLPQIISTLWDGIKNMNPKIMSYGSNAYDTAWVSLIQDENGEIIFPKSYDWLIQNQLEDGSWGSKTFRYFDRMLSTLIATVALLEYNKDTKNLEKSIKWLKENLDKLKYYSDHEDFGIGFGLLFPSLLLKLKKYIDIGFNSEQIISKWRKKIEALNLNQILKKFNYLSWSLEFLDPIEFEINLDTQLTDRFSIGESVAATSWYIMTNKSKYNAQMIKFLKTQEFEDGSFPQFAQSDAYNLLFMLSPIYQVVEYIPNMYHKQLIELRDRFTKQGISLSEYFDICDSDDTIVLMKFLENEDLVDDYNKFNFIEFYEDENFYNSYVSKHGKSTSRKLDTTENDRTTISVNMRILNAYYHSKIAPNRDYVVNKLYRSFVHYFENNEYASVDRWHADPSYNNSNGVLYLSTVNLKWGRQCLDWFDKNKNENGRWGKNEYEYENTARAFLSYAYFHIITDEIDLSFLDSLMSYLINNYNSKKSELWVSKTLYCPDFNEGLYLACFIAYAKIKKIEYNLK